MKIPNAYVVELSPHGDSRGFFSRVLCQKEFKENGLDERVVQINNSYNKEKGTLRGLHYQLPPSQETKLVRVVRGSLWDVIVDLRQDSPTFGQWDAVTLTAEKRNMIMVPRGCAHGIITLEDDTEMLYFVSEFSSISTAGEKMPQLSSASVSLHRDSLIAFGLGSAPEPTPTLSLTLRVTLILILTTLNLMYRVHRNTIIQASLHAERAVIEERRFACVSRRHSFCGCPLRSL